MRVLMLILLMGMSFEASAYFQMDLLKGKRAKVDAKPWTLAEWLQQKSKARQQDEWLAMHTAKSWLDVGLLGAEEQYKFKDTSAAIDENKTGSIYQVDMYITIFNLLAEYEKGGEDIEGRAGALGLRILGASSQSTSMGIRYGIRRLHDKVADDTWSNPFAETWLHLYIFPFFGLDGSYRYFFTDTSDLGTKLTGSRAGGGVFLEYSLLRLTAGYFTEPLKFEGTANKSITRQGYVFGAALLF